MHQPALSMSTRSRPLIETPNTVLNTRRNEYYVPEDRALGTGIASDISSQRQEAVPLLHVPCGTIRCTTEFSANPHQVSPLFSLILTSNRRTSPMASRSREKSFRRTCAPFESLPEHRLPSIYSSSCPICGLTLSSSLCKTINNLPEHSCTTSS